MHANNPAIFVENGGYQYDERAERNFLAPRLAVKSGRRQRFTIVKLRPLSRAGGTTANHAVASFTLRFRLLLNVLERRVFVVEGCRHRSCKEPCVPSREREVDYFRERAWRTGEALAVVEGDERERSTLSLSF